MLAAAVNLLRPAAFAEQAVPAAEVDGQYRRWRSRILYASLIGYALFYLVRKNLSLAMPMMEKDLGVTKSDLGLFLTLHGVLYGFSKFANGFLGDRTNPRYFMALGLVLSAVMNLCFGLSSAVYTLGFFWLLNGWFQGMGFPPCARSLTHWFSPEERGTRFAIWNTSHSIGAAAALILCSFLVEINWRLCFLAPAALAVIGAVFLIERLRDTPRSMGLPTIEEYRSPPIGGFPVQPAESGGEWQGSAAVEGTEPAASVEQADLWQFTIRHVFLNPFIWMVSLANFFVYTIRYAVLDWGPTILTEMKGIKLQHAGWTRGGLRGGRRLRYVARRLADRSGVQKPRRAGLSGVHADVYGVRGLVLEAGFAVGYRQHRAALCDGLLHLRPAVPGRGDCGQSGHPAGGRHRDRPDWPVWVFERGPLRLGPGLSRPARRVVFGIRPAHCFGSHGERVVRALLERRSRAGRDSGGGCCEVS